MIINSVHIKNFRGIEGEKYFSFENSKLIVLSASNGKGKTTVIDAIEWCLTGNIGRLANSYDLRSTNNEERKKNVDGLLKNKNCLNSENVTVEVKIVFKRDVYKIKRTQVKDILNESDSKLFINGKTENAKNILEKFVDKNFYNYYFCDVQKTFNLLSKKRTELPELFTEFISDYSREEIIVKNLIIFQEDIDRKIEEHEINKISKQEINSYNETLERYKNVPEILPYNKIKLYDNEQIECTNMNSDQIPAQLEVLYKCGYYKAYEILKEIDVNESNVKFIKKLEEINNFIKNNEDKINEALKLGFQNDYNVINNLESEINKLNKIQLNIANIQSYLLTLFDFKNPRFTQSIYEEKNENIQEIIKKIQILDNEIILLSKGNTIIESLSSLVSKKEGILEYRKKINMNGEIANCPLCGSSKFNVLNDESIFKIANEYLGEHNKLIVDKKKEKEELRKEKDKEIDNLIIIGKEIIKNRIEFLEQNLHSYKVLKNNTEEFFVLCSEIIKEKSNNYTIQNICSKDFIMAELNVLQKHTKKDNYIENRRKESTEILTLLGYSYGEYENNKTTLARVNALIKDCPEILQFSINILTEKINSLKSLISNNEYQIIRKKLELSTAKNEDISLKIKKLGELKIKAQKRIDDIQYLVMELKKNEYKNVGPFLHKFYRKLSRVESVKNISVIHDSGKISLKDEKEKSLLNVLSNGQLSVFMLAFFLGGAVSRNQSDMFKVYFIDDLTACMDDINMLSFIDFMKYLLLEDNRFMEQIFFVTCDDRVRRLIQYKMNGGGIEFKELGEEAFA